MRPRGGASIDFQEVIDNSGDYLIEDGQKIIAEHFTELRETYEKLVELAALYNFKYDIHKQMAIGVTTAQEAEEYNRKMTRLEELESDPHIQSAIERSKG